VLRRNPAGTRGEEKSIVTMGLCKVPMRRRAAGEGKALWRECGGGGGIRTHGALSDTRDFQSRPLGLYGTPPGCSNNTRLSQRVYLLAVVWLPGGRGGIRTRGALFRHAAFRERYHKPLGHPSAAQYTISPSGAASAGYWFSIRLRIDRLEGKE
jgi:hypothetical protein